jgi:hypothetical protein
MHFTFPQFYVFPEFALHFSSPGYENLPQFILHSRDTHIACMSYSDPGMQKTPPCAKLKFKSHHVYANHLQPCISQLIECSFRLNHL